MLVQGPAFPLLGLCPEAELLERMVIPLIIF